MDHTVDLDSVSELKRRKYARFIDNHDDHEGAGLGLAIVRAIVESHGGSAIAENRRGGGGGVILILPTGGSARPGP